jgi:hypothetical protein
MTHKSKGGNKKLLSTDFRNCVSTKITKSLFVISLVQLIQLFIRIDLIILNLNNHVLKTISF